MDLSSIGVSAREQMAWQERLANTAHQRQVADLKAAGLNPVLSAKLGGAEVPSGANDLAQLAGLSGSGGSGGASGQLPGGVSIGDYISSLNPNGSSRFGKITIPNWALQWAHNKAVEVLGSDPTIAQILGFTPGAENVDPKVAEQSIINQSAYGIEVPRSEGVTSASSVKNGYYWPKSVTSTTLWPLFHAKYPTVSKSAFLSVRKGKAKEEWDRFKSDRVG